MTMFEQLYKPRSSKASKMFHPSLDRWWFEGLKDYFIIQKRYNFRKCSVHFFRGPWIKSRFFGKQQFLPSLERVSKHQLNDHTQYVYRHRLKVSVFLYHNNTVMWTRGAQISPSQCIYPQNCLRLDCSIFGLMWVVLN